MSTSSQNSASDHSLDEMLFDLESLRKAAVAKARESGSIRDIDKVAAISKVLAETQQQVSEAHNQPRVMQWEQLKSWATFLVPFLTLVTIAVTVGMQYAQLKATREANEDLKWREHVKLVLDSLKQTGVPTASRSSTAREDTAGSGAIPDPLMAATLLKSYVNHSKYSKDALDLSFLVLTRIASSEIFKDFYTSMGIEVTWSNINQFIGVNRNLWTQQWTIWQRLKELPEDKQSLDPDSFIHSALVDELIFISQRIGELIQNGRPRNVNLNLSRAFILRTNLSGADLTNADLTSSRFENVNLSRARLTGITRVYGADLSATNWWEAHEISPNLLEHLITTNPPADNISYDIPPPSKAEYVEKIRHLCKVANAKCPSDLPYNWSGKAPDSVEQ